MKKISFLLLLGFFLLSGCVRMGDNIPIAPNELWRDDTYNIYFGRKELSEDYRGEMVVESTVIKIIVSITMGGTIDVRHSSTDDFRGEMIFSGKYSYSADEEQIIMTVRPKDDKENIFGGEKVILRFSHEIIDTTEDVGTADC